MESALNDHTSISLLLLLLLLLLLRVRLACAVRSKCKNNQVFLVPNDPHPYCMNACEPVTMCGEVQVPEHHLEVRSLTFPFIGLVRCVCVFFLVHDRPNGCPRQKKMRREISASSYYWTTHIGTHRLSFDQLGFEMIRPVFHTRSRYFDWFW